MAQPPSKFRDHHHHHHHHHTQHITDPARRKKKHLPAQLAQLQLDHEEDGPNNNVSSSRDASEEDNDDQEETFDDNASIASLRQHQQLGSVSASDFPISASTSSIPPSERDQVLIDSAALHQTAKNAVHDRTPSSTSPPRTTATGSAVTQPKTMSPHQAIQPHLSHQQQPASQQTRDASSDDDYAERSVGATLANASAALSSSSSTELVPKSLAQRHTSVDLEQSRKGASLNLGTLPPAALSGSSASGNKPNLEASLGVPMLNSSVVTPRANQVSDVPIDLTSDSTSALPTSKRKVSGSHHASNAASRQADLNSTGDDDTNTDGGTPYDGDVEYAARTPGGLQPASGKDGLDKASLSSASTGAHLPSTTQQLQPPRSTAPEQVPYRTYIQTMNKRHADCHPEGDDFVEGGFQPSSIPSPEAIQKWVNDAIFHPDPRRDYAINPPAKRLDSSGRERPIRIYADGVYDLFHYAHALQLRQAKLSFPSVHLIVGVVSSHSCAVHKNKPVLNSMERYECVRNCRWVDEVLEDAPWIVDQTLIDTLEIDYIAHDDLPYSGKGMEDIYAFVKRQGRFLPTRRTDGVSTSELLGRIVEVYKGGNLDGKLAKIGLNDLTSKPVPEEQEE